MRHLCLSALFLFTIAGFSSAQRKETSVCVTENTDAKPAVLTICNKHTGMTGFPTVRLYLRVHEDGSAEYEENPPWVQDSPLNHTLVMRTMKVDPDKLAEIKKLIAAADLQNAKADYPRFRMWTDSGVESTLTVRAGDKTKKIFLRNYTVGDGDNDKNYPASLNALLKLTGAHWWGQKELSVPNMLEYKGDALEVGKTYRGQVNFGDAYGMRLTKFPRLPEHHSVQFNWTNVKDFPDLDPDKDFGVRWVVFKVADKRSANLSPDVWATTFTIEIVKVEK